MAKHRKDVNEDELDKSEYVHPERRECSDAFCDRNAGHERWDNKGHSIAGNPS